MALNSLFCADMPLRNYTLTLTLPSFPFWWACTKGQHLTGLSVVCGNSMPRWPGWDGTVMA